MGRTELDCEIPIEKTIIHLYIEKFDLCVTEGKYIKDFRNFSLPLVLKLKGSTSP